MDFTKQITRKRVVDDDYRLDEPVVGSQKTLGRVHRRWTKEIQPIHNQSLVVNGQRIYRDS